jgi:hypothetical protein
MRFRFASCLGIVGCGLLGAAVACGTSATPTMTPAPDGGTGADGSTGTEGGAEIDGGLDATGTIDVASPPPCASIDPAGASQAVLQGIDTVLLPGIDAFAAADTSATLARALSLGASSSATPVKALHDAATNLRTSFADRLLLPSYVESTDGGQVTYLIPPSVLCGDGADGGDAGSSSTDGGCESQAAAHPLRIRVYRVACEAGGGVEVDWLVGNDRALLLGIELDAARVIARLFLAPLNEETAALTSTQTTTSSAADGGSITTTVTTTLAQLDPGATGVVAATLETTGPGKAHAVLSIPEAIALGVTSADGGAHIGLNVAAAAAVVDVSADGDAGTVSGALGLGDSRLTLPLSSFVQSFFGRSLASSANANDPVVVDLSGIGGHFGYGTGSALAVTGLGLGAGGLRATHSGADLLQVEVAPDSGGTVDFQATADDAGVTVVFATSFALDLRYTMSSVASSVNQLPAFASDDLLSIRLAGASPSTATLLGDAGSPLALVGSQTGRLLRVQSGALDLTSTFAPDASVHVPASQCLVRTPGQTGPHDVLKDLSAAACP